MADEANQGNGTEEQAEQKQTISAEEFATLQKQLEETRKAQSGSDRTVQELKELLKQREQEAEEQKKSAEEKMAERIEALESRAKSAEREKQIALQRSVAVEMLSEVGLKAPKYLDRLIGQDAEETEALIKEYIADKQATKLEGKDEVAKKHGRTVTKTEEQGYGGMSYAELAALPEAEFNKVPSDIVDKAMESELTK